MKFKVISKAGVFGKLNTRPENHGDSKVAAVDVPVTWVGSKREFDMLVPMQDGKYSDIMWDKAGNVMLPFLSPFPVHRKPDTVQVLIYDKGDNAAPLKFEDCTVKNIKVTVNEKRNVSVTMTLQLHPEVDKDMARLTRLMCDNTPVSFQCEASQEDFFDEDPEDDDKQADLDDE